jgi:hypothetical protein
VIHKNKQDYYTGSLTYDHKILNFFCDPILFAICTSKIINKLIINQAAAWTKTLGASSTVLFFTLCTIINLKDHKNKLKLNKKLYKDHNKIRNVKNIVNKYMADLRPTSQNGSWS